MTKEEILNGYFEFVKGYIEEKKKINHQLVPMVTFEHLLETSLSLHEENVRLRKERRDRGW